MGVPPIPFAHRSRYGDSIASLLAQRGDIAARGAERSGQIWGGAVSQLGQIAGGAIQAHSAEQERKQEVELFQDILSDPETLANPQKGFMRFAAAFGPERAGVYMKGLSAYATAKQQQQQAEAESRRVTRNDAMEQLGPMVDSYMATKTPEAKGFIYQGLYDVATAADLDPEGRLPTPDQFDPAIVDPIAAAFRQGYGEVPEPGGEILQTVDAQGNPIRRRASEEELASPQGVPVYQTPELTLEEQARQREVLAAATARGTAAGQPPAPLPSEKPPTPWGTATTDAERKRITAMRYGLKKVPGLKKFLKENPDVIGPIEGRVTKFQQKWGIRASEMIAEREAELAVLRNAIVNALSGVAVNPQEFERLKEQIPNIEDSEQVFKGKMVILEEYFNDNLAAFGLGASPGGSAVALPAETQAELDRLFPPGSP